MSITLGLIGAGVGLASSLYGAHKSAVEAEKQEQELARQRAANEAWYNRNYYQDYLNTVQAQNALKQYRNVWAERTKEARARQAISGGTPEQAQAVAEAGGEAMGNMIGNLAAKGQQDRTAIDAQKLAMDNNLSQQAAQIAEARQQAASNLMSSGASLIGSSLQGLSGLGDTRAASGEESSDIKVPETKGDSASGSMSKATKASQDVPEIKTPQVTAPTQAESVQAAEATSAPAPAPVVAPKQDAPKQIAPPPKLNTPADVRQLGDIAAPAVDMTLNKVPGVTAPDKMHKAKYNGVTYNVFYDDGKWIVDAPKNTRNIFGAMRSYLEGKEGGLSNVYYITGKPGVAYSIKYAE